MTREVDPFAAGFEQQRDLVGLEGGILHLETDGEVEPVLLVVGGGGDRELDAGAERLAQQAGEFGRKVDGEVAGELGVPVEKLLGKVIAHRADPRARPAIPNHAKAVETRAGGEGGGGVELQGGLADDAGRWFGIFAPTPTAGLVGELLLAGRMVGAGDELGVEIAFVHAVEGGRQPAFKARPQLDDAQFGLHSLGQPQADGVQTRQQAGVAQGGGRQALRRHTGWAAPDASLEQVEGLGTRGEEDGGIGGDALRRDEVQVETIRFVRGFGGFGHERQRLDFERRAVGQGEGGAHGGGAQERDDGFTGQRFFRCQPGGGKACFGGEGGGERGFGGRKRLEIGRAQTGEVGEPALGRGLPRFVGGSAHFHEPVAGVVQAHAQPGEIGQGVAVFREGFFLLGRGQGVEPTQEFGFERVFGG